MTHTTAQSRLTLYVILYVTIINIKSANSHVYSGSPSTVVHRLGASTILYICQQCKCAYFVNKLYGFCFNKLSSFTLCTVNVKKTYIFTNQKSSNFRKNDIFYIQSLVGSRDSSEPLCKISASYIKIKIK